VKGGVLGLSSEGVDGGFKTTVVLGCECFGFRSPGAGLAVIHQEGAPGPSVAQAPIPRCVGDAPEPRQKRWDSLYVTPVTAPYWAFQLHWDPLCDPRRCGLLPAQAALRHDAKQYTKNVRLRVMLMQLRQQKYACGIEPVHALQVLPHTISEAVEKLGHVTETGE